MIKAIIWDFDGTLVDTAPLILILLKKTLKEFNKEIPSDKVLRSTIGLLLKDAFIFLGLSEEEAVAASARYRELYFLEDLSIMKEFPEVTPTLEYFTQNGIVMSMATSRGEKSLTPILEINNLKRFFDPIITASNNLPPKPAPDQVLAVLDKIGIAPENVLVVGDTTFDINMGKSAGCHTCAVTYGNHPRKLLEEAKPDFIVDNFKDIKFVIDSL